MPVSLLNGVLMRVYYVSIYKFSTHVLMNMSLSDCGDALCVCASRQHAIFMMRDHWHRRIAANRVTSGVQEVSSSN